MTLQEAYVRGLEDGIRAYAWMKQGFRGVTVVQLDAHRQTLGGSTIAAAAGAAHYERVTRNG